MWQGSCKWHKVRCVGEGSSCHEVSGQICWLVSCLSSVLACCLAVGWQSRWGEMADVVLFGGEVVGLDDAAVLEIGSLFFSPLLRFDLCGNLRDVFYPAFHVLGIPSDLPQVAQAGRVVGKVAQLGLAHADKDGGHGLFRLWGAIDEIPVVGN